MTGKRERFRNVMGEMDSFLPPYDPSRWHIEGPLSTHAQISSSISDSAFEPYRHMHSLREREAPVYYPMEGNSKAHFEIQIQHKPGPSPKSVQASYIHEWISEFLEYMNRPNGTDHPIHCLKPEHREVFQIFYENSSIAPRFNGVAFSDTQFWTRTKFLELIRNTILKTRKILI
jgi:hypothetical protein